MSFEPPGAKPLMFAFAVPFENRIPLLLLLLPLLILRVVASISVRSCSLPKDFLGVCVCVFGSM